MSVFRYLWPVAAVLASTGFLVEDIQLRRLHKAFSGPVETAIVESVRNLSTHEITKRRSSEVVGYAHTGDITFTTQSGRRVSVPNVSVPWGAQGGFRIEYVRDDPHTVRFAGQHESYDPNRRWMLVGLVFASLFWLGRTWWKRPEAD